MKKSFLTLFLLLLLFTAGTVLAYDSHSNHYHSEQEEETEMTEEHHDKPVNIDNKICPVMNAPINEKSKVTYEYTGKIYNFCCASCIGDFKKNPEKHIAKIEREKNKN